MKSIKFVIARYNEDISWVKDLDYVVVQKDIDLPNKGREPSSYIWYIITQYKDLQGIYLFTQGEYSDHCKNLLIEADIPIESFVWFGDETHISDMQGRPHDNCGVGWLLDTLGIKHGDSISFKPGCIFAVSAEQIKKRPIEFYEKLYSLLITEENRSPWAFERCVEVIFNG